MACNTASTVSLPALREKFPFPVVGRCPGNQTCGASRRRTALWGCWLAQLSKTSYTRELIRALCQRMPIAMLGSAELVEVADEARDGEAVSLEELRRILPSVAGMQEPPDTVVLGCTHFPLLQEELLKVLPEGTRWWIPVRRCTSDGLAAEHEHGCEISGCKHRVLYGDNKRNRTTFAVLRRYGLGRARKTRRCSTVFSKKETVVNVFKEGLWTPENSL
ncbi:hypothetical protein ACNKHO_25480 [Shigella flexneri]